jgi:Coenzyme PQQ synthesis protein D (PqqD)
MSNQELPRRRAGCLQRRLEEEIVIYDRERHIGHCLNSTAAAVWGLCDGKHSIAQIATDLSQELSTHIDQSVVQLALRQLEDAHLLVEPKIPAKLHSRRVAMRTIGIAATIALPLVTSLVAPTPASAASCFHNGHACTSGVQCCSGICLPGLICLGG